MKIFELEEQNSSEQTAANKTAANKTAASTKMKNVAAQFYYP